MQCQFCKIFESYKDQNPIGGQSHWLEWGFCDRLRASVKETDRCHFETQNKRKEPKHETLVCYQI